MVQGIAYRIKEYVKVTVEVDVDGTTTPLCIELSDGRRFDIDECDPRAMRTAASFKVGGHGDRYTIRIGTSRTYLFCENGRWFVELKVRE